MHVANLDLCKALYEVSGWDDTHFWYWINNLNTNDYIVEETRHTIMQNIPAYDLGYLLRKLPMKLETLRKVNRPFLLGQYLSGDYFAKYSHKQHSLTVEGRAPTPEDAAAKLAIELFRQGILTKLEVAGSDE